ncbi:leucine-rich repeat-containing protein kinase family protein [Aliivibrio fischeri]|uniref:leucine-rich repeat-containing protein kinase family protein n=1 Tax=Aliivibrio fischeri TaxID=668 RepID=UPI001F3BE632|nr:leucine-rich repeat-containing protein kinase family protein [Aliivibrio fischeri]MCE7555091.1 leucine-rich repeat-containing serine/threonine-protein kinase [Aliivibrio fischeri]MCE7562359.1 leucine-rich repeat-containing serine/threonine-protein kinase [Aliivibrio fischeri]MCE7569767.1 leucine-rich repeat-containing serine/threonine-protein kinase [Aliivibrio fischeri]
MHTLAQLQSGELQGITRLQLSEQLTEFPKEILSLADSLEILDLSNNQLTTLPNEINQLSKLKIFFASNNPFTVFPDALAQCENLEMIGFKSCQIKQISESAFPPKLRWLILTNNQLETVPDALGECNLMQKLALAGNKLTELPNSLSQLHNLELLRISANQLTKCPDQLLDLPKLAWFAFAGNPFCKSDLKIKSVPTVSSSDYTLENVLGQGASGVISKAHWNKAQTDFPQEIAVKVFKGEVTSDGYPEDELQACLKVGNHPSLVQSLAQVNEENHLALIMNLIPAHYKNLGLPPSLESCTRDTFPNGFSLSLEKINKMTSEMCNVFNHLHDNQVCHGDLYAHNTLFDNEANIIFGDFGAASMYHMLSTTQQQKIRTIEERALDHFIDDLMSVCEH